MLAKGTVLDAEMPAVQEHNNEENLPTTMPPKYWSEWKVVDLKQELKWCGLKVLGKKSVLTAHLTKCTGISAESPSKSNLNIDTVTFVPGAWVQKPTTHEQPNTAEMDQTKTTRSKDNKSVIDLTVKSEQPLIASYQLHQMVSIQEASASVPKKVKPSKRTSQVNAKPTPLAAAKMPVVCPEASTLTVPLAFKYCLTFKYCRCEL